MKLISDHNFSVTPGEEITIRVTPVALPNYIFAVTLDGYTLGASGGDGDFPAKYSFTVTQPAGMSHSCVLQAGFISEASGDAAYEVWVEGSYGGGEQFSLRNDGQTDVARDLRFFVEEGEESWRDDPPIIVHEEREGIQPLEPWD